LICKNGEQYVYYMKVQEDALVIQIKYEDLAHYLNSFDEFIQVVKQTDTLHIVPVGEFVIVAHWVRENAVLHRMDSVRFVNKQMS